MIRTWERAVKMPFACLRENITLQGTMHSGYSIRCEEFCCSYMGEAHICLTLHQFYYLKIVRNLKYNCYISVLFLSSLLTSDRKHKYAYVTLKAKYALCSVSPLLSDYHIFTWCGTHADRDQSLLNKPLNVAVKGESTGHYWHHVAKNSPSLAVH